MDRIWPHSLSFLFVTIAILLLLIICKIHLNCYAPDPMFSMVVQRAYIVAARHPWAKGFTNFAESPRYSRISPPSHAGDLKGRQVKVPPSGVFFPRCSRSLYSACLPSTAAPHRTGPDVALSRARASFFFRGERSGTCGAKVSESRSVA